jgi:hypothetical protein
LPPFLVQPDRPSRAARQEILDLHLQRCGDAREGISECGYQRAVAQIAQSGGRNVVEECSPFGAVEHRRLAGFDDVLRPAHRRRRIHRHDLARYQRVKQHAQGRELLLDTRRPVFLLQVFHPGGHVERPNGREREPAIFAPGEKPAAGARIGPPRVVVVDVGGEEFDIAPAGLVAAGIGDECRHYASGSIPAIRLWQYVCCTSPAVFISPESTRV